MKSFRSLLKTKYKYSDITNNNDNSLLLDDKQFITINTVGIVNYANFENYAENFIDIWNNKLRNDLVDDLKFYNFKIKIKHYDPLYNVKSKNKALKYINKNLIKNDKLCEEIISSEFISDKFYHNDKSDMNLMIDFANIFDYDTENLSSVKYFKEDNLPVDITKSSGSLF